MTLNFDNLIKGKIQGVYLNHWLYFLSSNFVEGVLENLSPDFGYFPQNGYRDNNGFWLLFRNLHMIWARQKHTDAEHTYL